MIRRSDVHTPDQVKADVNTVAAFLAAPDIREPSQLTAPVPDGQNHVEMLILLGNSVLHTVDVVARAVNCERVDTLLVVGGEGHSTSYLRHSVRRDARYQDLLVDGRTEAEIFRDMLVIGHGVDEENIILESESTNCGENAEFAYQCLQARGMDPEQIVLVQDPTMQRRTQATFRHVWGSDARTQFFNFPTFVPTVWWDEGRLRFEEPRWPGLWSMERFVSLLMGEIPRLRNDEDGYGPQGRGYIVEVEIPEPVSAAYDRLRRTFDEYVRVPG